MRAALLIALATLLPTVARAERALVVVNGAANAQARAVVTTAVTAVLSDAGWKLPRDVDADQSAIAGCFDRDRPWSCVAPLVHRKRIDRVVVVTVDRDHSADDLVLTASLALAESDEPSRSREPCQSCNDTLLEQAARALATTVVSHARRFAHTTLTITTQPRGANVSIDDAPQGQSPLTVVTSSGPHEVVVTQQGWVNKTVHVDAAAGKETPVDIALAAAPPPPAASRPVWPLAVILAGIAATATGTIMSLDAKAPPPPATQPKYIYSGPGIALAIGGALTMGAGIYLWLRTPSSHPTVVALPGGAAIGWTTAF
jgi:hypothetical protein